MTPVLRTNGLLAGAGLSAATAPAVRANVLDDSLVGFLALLVLLLALALIAIIRFEPPERGPIAEETAQAAMPAQAAVPAPAYRAPGLPTRPSGQRQVVPTPLPVRPVGQQSAYTARHAPGPVRSQGAAERPRISGGPPWGPAPRPPGLDPFLRSSD